MFLYPHYLFLSLLCLPASFIYFLRLKKLKTFLNSKEKGSAYIFKLKLRAVLFSLGWIFSCIAISTPIYGKKNIAIHKKGKSIIFVMDASRSMTIKEDGISRLSLSKYIASLIIKKYPQYAYALVVAKGEGLLNVPLTFENATLQENIANISPKQMTSIGTNLEAGLLKAATSFNKERGNEHIAILFTDGGETKGNILNSVNALYNNDVRLIIVGIGSKTGSEMEVIGKNGNKEIIRSVLNEKLLKEMVIRCKNESLYIEGASLSSLKNLFASLEEGKNNMEKIVLREEAINRSGQASLLALCFFCLGIMVAYKFSLIKFFSFACFFIIFCSCSLKEKQKFAMLQGSIAWQKKDWKVAEKHFANAIEIAQSNKDKTAYEYASYAISSTYLMQNNIDQALTHLKNLKNLEDRQLTSSVFYQLGIIAFMHKDYKVALSCFKKSLEAESNHLDAKINYELTQKKIDAQIIEKTRKTMINQEETEEAYNTLVDILKLKEVEKWEEKTKNPKKEEIYDY